MIAKLSVLGLILSSYQYLRSAMVWFPFALFSDRNVTQQQSEISPARHGSRYSSHNLNQMHLENLGFPALSIKRKNVFVFKTGQRSFLPGNTSFMN